LTGCPGLHRRLAREAMYRSLGSAGSPDRLPRNGQGVLSVSRVWGARWPLLGPGRVLLWPAGPGTRRENRRFPGRRSLYWHPTPRADSMGRISSPCFAPRRPGGANWVAAAFMLPSCSAERRPAQLRPGSSRNRLGCQPTGRRRPAANMRACEVRYGALGAVGSDNPSRRRFIGHERSA
jgi:hypothetical protein